MDTKNYLYILIIVSIIVILVNISTTFIKLSEFKKQIFGYATSSEGYMNITVDSYIILNLSRDSIYWGAGAVDSESMNATLYTNNDSDGTVERGNWSGENVNGFILENLGTVNCLLSIQSGKDAHDFFMSENNSNEQYMFKVTNKEDNSCNGTTGEWINATKSSGGYEYCNNFSYDRNNNEIYIDVLLTIPRDANKLGVQSDDIVIIATPTT
jgi:hypothetical protein